MTSSPAHGLDLDGLDPWADGEQSVSLSSPNSTNGNKEGASTHSAKSNGKDVDSGDGGPLSAIKVPVPRPFRTAPLTTSLSLLKGKGRSLRGPTSTSPPRSPTAGASSSTEDGIHRASIDSQLSRRSRTHPLAEDDLATKTASLSLDEEDYSYGAYAHSTGALVNSTTTHPRHRTPMNRSRSASLASPYGELDMRDVTRPALNRMTSETERQLSIGSWSAASSENGNGQTEDEIEFIVHTVRSQE